MLQNVHFIKTVPEAVDQALLEFTGGRDQRVKLPQACLTDLHEARFPQVRQVAGHFGLREPERVMDVADAELAAREQMENPQTGLVRKCVNIRSILGWGLILYPLKHI